MGRQKREGEEERQKKREKRNSVVEKDRKAAAKLELRQAVSLPRHRRL